MVSAAVVHLAVDCYKRCAYTKLFCTKLRRGRVSLPAFYDILRNLIEIVLLLCFQNLLAYGFALFAVFSKFALLRSQILKRGSLALFVRNSAMQINGFYSDCNFRYIFRVYLFSCIGLFGFYSFAWLYC